MRDNLFSVTGGIFGAFLAADLMEIAMQVSGTIILAFVGGIAGVLGKKFCDYMIGTKKPKK